MFRNFRLSSFVAPLIALSATLVLAAPNAEAQVKPFKLTGGGIAPLGIALTPGVAAPHSSVGTATELGNHTGAGFFQILDYTSPTTAEFSSAPDYTFTAANGDQLTFTYGVVRPGGAQQPGQVTLSPVGDGSVTAVFVAEFNPVPAKCTGRFAKVTGGSVIMIATSSPFFLDFQTGTTTPFTYTWQGDGWIEFGKGHERGGG